MDPFRFGLDNTYYGMDDNDSIDIEEIEIARMEGGDAVGEMRQQAPPTIPIPNPSTSAGSSSGSTSSKRSKTLTSPAWQYFDVEWKVDEKGNKQKMAVCKYCKKVLSANPAGGTRHLNTHGEKCAKKHLGGREPTQSQLQFNPDGSVSTWTYDPNVARESLSRMICATDLPINFGESPYYEDHIRRSFCPQFQKVTRNTTRNDIITYYNKTRAALKNEISSLNFCVALTSDIWNGRAREDYLSVVAHYVDNNWIMQKRIIGFKLIDVSHNAENIAERIASVVADYDISNRIISITLDNASANTRAIRLLEASLGGYVGGGFLLHQRCACHIINLIVQAGMNLVSESLNNIRNAISWINVSNKRIAEFKKYCVAENLRPRKFATDMPVRWNSTYLMLKNLIPYKNAITVFCNSKMGQVVLEDSDWFIGERFYQFLEVFYDCTVSLSGIYYPTSPLVLHHLLEITNIFNMFRCDSLFRSIVLVMEEKFKKYWTEIPYLYSFAFILDPRIKLIGLSNTLTHIGESLNVDYTNIYTEARNKFFEVYTMYENKFSSLREQQQPQQTQPRMKKRSSWAIIGSSSSSTSSSAPRQSSQTSQYVEVNKYLEVDFNNFDSQDEDFNILAWWRERQSRFPVLSRLARDVLTVPVSTVSSESAFSTTGRIIEERRTSLTSEMVEILTCVKDWEHAAKRDQHSTHNEDLVATFENLYINDDVPDSTS